MVKAKLGLSKLQCRGNTTPESGILRLRVRESYGGNRDRRDRERGGFRGRRRRRGGRRDGRGDGRGDGRNEGRNDGRNEVRSEGRERSSEPRFARPPIDSVPAPVAPRAQESGRSQQFGPPAGYQPILLPGESISKYRGMTQAPLVQERRAERKRVMHLLLPPSQLPRPLWLQLFRTTNPSSPMRMRARRRLLKPELLKPGLLKPGLLKRKIRGSTIRGTCKKITRRRARVLQRQLRSTGTANSAGRNCRVRPLQQGPAMLLKLARSLSRKTTRWWLNPSIPIGRRLRSRTRGAGSAAPALADPVFATPVFATPGFATPGTLEEETIDEDEADTVRYEESSDEGYDEFEEETRAAPGHDFRSP